MDEMSKIFKKIFVKNWNIWEVWVQDFKVKE